MTGVHAQANYLDRDYEQRSEIGSTPIRIIYDEDIAEILDCFLWVA